MRARSLHSITFAVPLLGALALAGCGGLLGASTGSDPDEDALSTGASTGSGAGEHPPSAECSEGVSIGPSPLRRLSRTEYMNTVRDLIAPVRVPSVVIGSDKTVDGFDNNEKTQTVTPDLVSDYYDAAEQIGAAVSADAAAFAGCSYGSPAEARACAAQVAERFGRRAYRRPLSAGEAATFEAFLASNAEEHGFEAALGMLVQGVLLSPGFLYRPEWGTPDPGTPEASPLDGYELASRLSYFLWQSMPDDRLFAAAESGALATPDGLREEAERLLADPRAREAVADFHRQWMDLDGLRQTSRDKALFPAWDDSVRPALAEATAMYLDHVFWDSEGTLSELFTAPKAYVNDAIAPLYGIDPPGTDELVLVDLDPSERAGFLTQVGPMAAMAHEKFDAPILRGVFILRKILCAKLGAPPPNVPDIPPATQGDRPKTTRQRIEESHAGAPCASCHDRIDPLGFAFNHYDAAGQWRAEENGLPIDATGELPELGAYDGAIELSRALAESEEVRACVATQWFRFAMGRTEAPADACALAQLTGSLAESGGTMRDLLLDIVLSDSFRYRSPLGGAP